MAIRSTIANGLIIYLNLPLNPLYFNILLQKINLRIYSILKIKKKI